MSTTQHPGLSREEYRRIRSEVDFRPSWSGQLLTLTLFGGTLGTGLALATMSGWPAYLVGVGLVSMAMFQAFAILHDCGHGSYARAPWVNVVVGHLASLVCVTAYWPWVYIHREHHRASLHPKLDPTAVRLVAWRTERIPWLIRFAWRSFVPLAAGVQQIVFATYPLRMLREGASSGRVARAVSSVLVLLVGVVGAFVAFPGVVRFETIGPAYVGYLVLSEVFNLPHHVDRPTSPAVLPPWQQAVTTRSCSYPPGFWLVSLHFNLHSEHHVFPDLPWYRLPDAQQRLEPALGEAYEQAPGLTWLWQKRRRPMQEVLAEAEQLTRETWPSS
ncbi:MAG: fatty acid desaturase [Myxococcota bacterium]